VARLDDFRSVSLTRNHKTRVLQTRKDKGHGRELELTIEAMRTGQPSPIAFEQLIEITEVTQSVQDLLTQGRAVSLPTPRKRVAHAAP
jgi:hypothetical protein